MLQPEVGARRTRDQEYVSCPYPCGRATAVQLGIKARCPAGWVKAENANSARAGRR